MVATFNFMIKINDVDKTSNILKNFKSLNITDNANDESDELTLEINGRFQRPKYKDEIKVYLGPKDDLEYVGLFRVETTSKSLTALSIKATGVNFGDNFKVKRSVTYEKLSIKDMVSQVAKRHSLKVKSDFDSLFIKTQSQTNESDMNFLNRLAKEYNAIFNVKNDTLYFMQKIKENKKSDSLPSYTIDVNKCSSISIEHSNKTLYNSCEVSWHDTKENKTITKTIPTNGSEPILKFNGSFQNEAEAIEKANAKLQRANQGLITGNLSKMGEVVYAGGSLKLLNNIDDDNEEYQITKTQYTINKQSGWTTNIDFER
jgi:phage protein D